MQTLHVNILPLSLKQDEQQSYQNFLTAIGQMAERKYWNGKRVAPTLSMDGSDLTVQGGRRHLSPHTIHFIHSSLNPSELTDEDRAREWMEAFEVLVLVCDARELLEEKSLRHLMTRYRSAMNVHKRYQDAILLLTGVEQVMDIVPGRNYTHTIFGMNAAFGLKSYNGTALKPEYQQVWNRVSDLLLAQNKMYFRLRSGKTTVSLPTYLTCQSPDVPLSGYLELLMLFFRRLMTDDNVYFSNIGTKRRYNMPFNISNVSKIISGRERHVRLAVIGATSSGKTYLLSDFVVAMQYLGYRPLNDMDAEVYHRPASNFINDVQNPDSGITKTPVYVCRNYNQYSSICGSCKNSDRRIRVDFVDVPGEVVVKDSLLEFQAIMESMLASKSKHFIERIWQQEGDVSVIKTVEFDGRKPMEDASTPVTTTSASGIDLIGTASAGSSLFGNDKKIGRRTLEYVSTDNRLDALAKSGFEETKKSGRHINARELFMHFVEYDTDTAIQAIYDAWDFLNIDSRITDNNASGSDLSAGISLSDDNRTRFMNVYKKHFYFHYYTYNATDVVVCDKCALPASVVETRGDNDVFMSMIRALSALTSFKELKKKRWYMAFKGIDSIMQERYFHLLYQQTKDLNLVYSFFMMLYKRKFIDLPKLSEAVDNPFGEATTDNFDDSMGTAEDLHELLTGRNVSEKVLAVCRVHLQDIGKYWKSYFKEQEEYRQATRDTISAHIENRLKAFLNIPDVVRPEPEDEMMKMLGMPPHVYLTATPIDYNFCIDGHDPQDKTKFTGESQDPENRICFGTLQLASDILQRENMDLDDDYADTGMILNYFYGNR